MFGRGRAREREGVGDRGAIQYVVRVKADRDDRGETLPILRKIRRATTCVREDRDGENPASMSGLTSLAGGAPCSGETDSYETLSFSGKCSVRKFLAKLDNCATYNRRSDQKKLHNLTNALEDPAAQILWDFQSDGAMSYQDPDGGLRK